MVAYVVSLAVGEMWDGIGRKNAFLSLNFTVGFSSYMVELIALQVTACLASLADNFRLHGL